MRRWDMGPSGTDHYSGCEVPVLSEDNMEMHPSMSIVTRFLTRTWTLAMRRALTVSERATHTGRPYAVRVSRDLASQAYSYLWHKRSETPDRIDNCCQHVVNPGQVVRSHTP